MYMVGPTYNENERIISGEGEREKKVYEKSDIESTGKARWPLSYQD